MHWTYKETPDLHSLEQGDLLAKTAGLQSILSEFHPYYASHKDNEYFLVLTQSCDIVKRHGSECKSRYISLAPVRSLRAVLKREFDEKLLNISPGAQPFASSKTRTSIEQFLERLFNNNEASFFYLEKNPVVGVTAPMCALLSLPIAIKAEHYEVCFASRVSSLKDEFQAKIGWLVGQLYSRVGTKDWDEAELRKKIQGECERAALWLPETEAFDLERLINEVRTAEPDVVIDAKKIEAMLKTLPKKKESVINRILELANGQGLVEDQGPQRFKFRKALQNNTQFGILFK